MRRFKRDLILMYKIYNKLIDINFEDFFAKSSSTYSTRGNSYRLQVPRYSGSTIRNNFFSNRVLIPWNELPDDLLNSSTLEIFKNKLNKMDLSKHMSNSF